MYQWQSYEMRYLGKNNFLLAWSNRKPTEVQKFQLNDVSLRKSGIDTDRTCKFLHNSKTEGLVFKIIWGYFNIVICCFAIFQSSLLIKILLISKKRNSFTQWKSFYYWLEVQLAYFVNFAHITFPHSKRVVHSLELLFSRINLHFLFFYLVLYL